MKFVSRTIDAENTECKTKKKRKRKDKSPVIIIDEGKKVGEKRISKLIKSI